MTDRRRRFALPLLLAALAPAGCEAMRHAVPAPHAAAAKPEAPAKKPGKHWLRKGPFVFYSDVPLEESDPLFAELETLPDQVRRELQLPAGERVVQVYLFETQGRYEAFMRERFPWLPVRSAYFIADGPRPGAQEELQVFTWMGEKMKLNLRHELTHATLHGVLKGVPLWLDEGLAGFFEQPPGLDGVNPAHLKELTAGGAKPDLARLEGFTQVKQMETREYVEAWAWVHFGLRDPGARPATLEYLQKLRSDAEPGPLLPKWQASVGDAPAALAAHLARTRVPSPDARAPSPIATSAAQ